jgi:hypothetical protein
MAPPLGLAPEPPTLRVVRSMVSECPMGDLSFGGYK